MVMVQKKIDVACDNRYKSQPNAAAAQRVPGRSNRSVRFAAPRRLFFGALLTLLFSSRAVSRHVSQANEFDHAENMLRRIRLQQFISFLRQEREDPRSVPR